MLNSFVKFCKQRYSSGEDLKARTGSMAPQARHTLAEEVAQSLGDAQDPETGENVEAILAQVEQDLEISNKQLEKSEEKEQFLATRIKKYNELLKQQEELEEKIRAAKKAERDEALKTVRELCKRHNFTANMLKAVLAEGRKRKPKAK